MRVIAGDLRGRRLNGPPAGDTGSIRPTTDRVRESLFNILSSGKFDVRIAGARVLDLFAGTGALGIEALSRGAAAATFVENHRASADLVQRNLNDLGLGDRSSLLRRDATRLPDCSEDPYDLIFLDPPYGKRMGEAAVAAAMAGGWLAPGATVVWEENQPPILAQGLVMRDQRTYGGTLITLAQVDT